MAHELDTHWMMAQVTKVVYIVIDRWTGHELGRELFLRFYRCKFGWMK